MEIRAKLLNPSRFLDRFRHKALGDSQTLLASLFGPTVCGYRSYVESHDADNSDVLKFGSMFECDGGKLVGTGTRPDYLVNRVPKKLKNHPGKKIARKSRNNCLLNGQGCG